VADQLDPLTLGLVLAGLGMGGTLITLFALSLVVDLLKRLFPAEPPAPKPPAESESPTPAPSSAPQADQ